MIQCVFRHIMKKSKTELIMYLLKMVIKMSELACWLHCFPQGSVMAAKV